MVQAMDDGEMGGASFFTTEQQEERWMVQEMFHGSIGRATAGASDGSGSYRWSEQWIREHQKERAMDHGAIEGTVGAASDGSG